MGVITIDYETFYSREMSLSKMSEVEYILDPQFQVIMCSIKINREPTEVFVGHDAIAARLRQIDWSRNAVLAHNTRFDGSILAWRFGVYPTMYLDTLSMARATTHWVIGRSSLKALSEHLQLPAKGTEVVQALGMRLEDFSDSQLEAYKKYCARDTDNCREIFDRLRVAFTDDELKLIDLILRMFIQPQVTLDAEVLAQHLDEVRAEKERILARVETENEDVFASNPKFAQLLRDYGVEVPLKISPTTGEMIPAIARNDRAFKELCADGTQPLEVQAILAARLAVKSTLEETRTANLLRLSQLDWPSQGAGWAPVPLKYSGARTHRLSGDGGTNWQNFQRGSMIRAAVVAPPGFRIIHRDSSQIEARMVAWLAREEQLLDAFRNGRDVYCEFATTIYGRLVTSTDKMERFVGKTSILGLGYGCGGEKFRHMLFIGNGGVSLNVTEDTARRIVYTYRNTYTQIPALWNQVEYLLSSLITNSRQRRNTTTVVAELPVETAYDALLLPSGLHLMYPDIRWYQDEQTGRPAMCYTDQYGSPRKIYGAKGVENISQALARIIVTDVALRVRQMTGYHPFLSTHDSLDFCVPASDAEDMDAELERQFSLVPCWAQGLPLASEGGWGTTLLDAERRVNQ